MAVSKSNFNHGIEVSNLLDIVNYVLVYDFSGLRQPPPPF